VALPAARLPIAPAREKGIDPYGEGDFEREKNFSNTLMESLPLANEPRQLGMGERSRGGRPSEKKKSSGGDRGARIGEGCV